ncbi:MAG: hypothetical protein AABY83_02305 [Pseudomonadota bacterium]
MNEETAQYFDAAAEQAVELGNELAKNQPDADIWEIADGILAGAIQYWLYSRQPCGNPRCADCAPLSTSQLRLDELQKLTRLLAQDSEYFHAPTDSNAGRA